ncbi:MAG: 3,5-nucleoside bisphosphate phosphatase [Tenuifilum sp.]|jgi:hypothetical protein|uniref:PHP domain-containing protein n=1 Tax=Tenuifilum sp. TaxID=2760880 RepID=UPI0024AAC363|nr:PHP domain-containing protein [Tenuifilum sp.]MDI3526445.1 3,5-nucleoside bisphosphate phosphatase [Tenuifilum sp.]
MRVKADLHIHSVISPCADLEMSPVNIVNRALANNLQLIAIADHNSTLHGPLTKELAKRHGIHCLYGAELTSKEEIHCLCIVETENQRVALQDFIENNILKISNKSDVFGYQVVVNEQEEIIQEVDYYLHAALNKSINEVSEFLQSIQGIFIPAHVDRLKYSLTSQLGFIPPDLKFDALEISKNSKVSDFCSHNRIESSKTFIRNSDAHYIHQVGEIHTEYELNEISLAGLRDAFNKNNGAFVYPF